MSVKTSFSFVGVCYVSAILIASSLQMGIYDSVPANQGLHMNETRRQVLITESDIPQVVLDLLKRKCDVTILNSTEEEILKILPQYDALLSRMKIDAKLLDAAGKRLKIISAPLSGYDHLDIVEIKRRGIRVGNTPKISSAAVAEIAVFLLLGAARRAFEDHIAFQYGLREQGYQRNLGHDLRNKTVGIVGLGNIGQEIVKRLKPFEIKNFVYSGHSKKAAGDQLGVEFVSFDSLLELSDFVVSSVPLTPETRNMFNDKVFQKMKETAVFVNVGRGKTVDTDAMIRALKNNTIFGVGLDVTEPEPLPFDHELLKLPNAVITPHLGARTIRANEDVILAATQNILNALDGEPMLYEL